MESRLTHRKPQKRRQGRRRQKDLPKICWTSTNPSEWRLPPGAVGWGLAHSRWHRLGMLSHLDWFPVSWSDQRAWLVWCRVNGVLVFADFEVADSLSRLSTVHAIARPGGPVVLREALSIEGNLGCVS
ncbi:MAG: hypothetical protein M1294_11145 [Firmicutes bacterium]|nr:hypothetical protein [Bacillota bacterium]MCL5015954.1 hypothetical protein [Bacillota bacterium]